MALFIRQNPDKSYQFVHYNPNPDETSNIVADFYAQFRNYSARGYNDLLGNKKGYCTYTSWKEIMNLITCKKNPFDFENLLKYDKRQKKYIRA